MKKIVKKALKVISAANVDLTKSYKLQRKIVEIFQKILAIFKRMYYTEQGS